MSRPPRETSPPSPFNVPNQITSLRLILAVTMFCLIPFGQYTAALILFLLAAGTDWVDGWYARKFHQVTVLGRILDPFADKVIICGTFIFLLAEPALGTRWYHLQAWMVVVIVGRELLVTALRGFIEQRGGDFSANMPGKLKMVLQCLAAASALYFLACSATVPGWVEWTFVVALWAAVLMTIYSGLIYVASAVRIVAGR